MQPEPLVSIIINNYNYGRFLREAIDSALQQDYRRTEVVVVDDGSTDGSAELIRGYGNRIVAVVKSNGGQGSAFNAGFRVARGEIICFEDADDYFMPNKVRIIVDALAKNPAAGWCYHAVRWVDVARKPVERDLPYTHARGSLDLREHMISGRVRFVAPPTSGLSFRASLLKKVLPMPECINITSDNYIKFISFGLEPGVYLDAELACQRIHADNAFTRKSGREKERTHARIKLLTARAIQDKHPTFRRFSDGLFASSVASYWANGGIDPAESNAVEEYLRHATFVSKFRLTIKTVFYLCRMAIKNTFPYAKYRDLSPHSPAALRNLHS